MKKLLVLSVLLGLMALPMFASDFSFGGDVTYGFITDFGDMLQEKKDLTFDIMAAVDDYNSVTINIDELETNTNRDGTSDVAGVGISKAVVATDAGKWLGLPVGLMINWGYDDPDWNSFAALSSYDLYSIYLSPEEYFGVDLLLSQKMFEVELAAKPMGADGGYLLAGVAVKEPIPGLNAELYYFQNQQADFADGWIAIDASYATEFSGFGLSVGPQFVINLSDVGDAYIWYFALEGTYSMFSFNAELTGDETDAFANMDAAVWISPIDKVDIYGGVVTSFREGEDAFQSADLGAKVKMGATSMFVGYLIAGDGATTITDINGYFSAPDGGFYAAWDINY